MNRIVYRTPEGTVAVVIPTEEALSVYSIEEIAQKDVPSGLAYKIVTDADIPSDRTFRNAWDIDEATLTDGVGGEHDMFVDDPQHPDYVAPVEVAE
jgi:hypothetical protein